MAKFPIFAVLPPLIFAGIAGMFYIGMNRENPDALPSTMIGREAPAMTIQPLGDHPFPDAEMLRADGVKLVNFWASWCAPCRAEHPNLEKLAASGVEIIGINYKDQPDNAQAFLTELGNPFTAIGADDTGRTGIEWGVYGVPETFILNADGVIMFRFPGPIMNEILENIILPEIAAAE